jgi:hypothetical protein
MEQGARLCDGAGGRFQKLEQAANDVQLQAALDFAQALAFGDASARVELALSGWLARRPITTR